MREKQRTRIVSVRYTEEELSWLWNESGEKGVSMSEYIRSKTLPKRNK